MRATHTCCMYNSDRVLQNALSAFSENFEFYKIITFFVNDECTHKFLINELQCYSSVFEKILKSGDAIFDRRAFSCS